MLQLVLLDGTLNVCDLCAAGCWIETSTVGCEIVRLPAVLFIDTCSTALIFVSLLASLESEVTIRHPCFVATCHFGVNPQTTTGEQCYDS